MVFSTYGQSFDNLFRDFENASGADRVNVSGLLLTFAKHSVKKGDNADIFKKMSAIQILDLSDCTSEIKSKFANSFNRLNQKDYEVLLRAKDDDDDVIILTKMQKDKIKEFVIVSKNDPAIIRVKGNFSFSDLSGLKKIEMK
jgi:hypothetical protein